MRTSVLATLLGLSLVGCAGQISGGGDDDIPETCGNGTIDPGEDCDGGEGCSATCTMEVVTPRLTVTADKTAITTALMRGEVVALTFTSEGAFEGTANIATSFVDETDAALPLITISGGPASVTLAAGQSMTASYIVTVPSNATGTLLNAKFKAAVTSDGGNADITTTFAIEPNLILSYAANLGPSTMNHPVNAGNVPKNLSVKRGAMVGYKNDDTIQHTTHGDQGFSHETDNGNTDSPNIGLPGGTYLQPTTNIAPGNGGNLGCHSHDGPAGYVTFTVE